MTLDGVRSGQQLVHPTGEDLSGNTSTAAALNGALYSQTARGGGRGGARGGGRAGTAHGGSRGAGASKGAGARPASEAATPLVTAKDLGCRAMTRTVATATTAGGSAST